jgi:outer membrane protein assembly factor BamB
MIGYGRGVPQTPTGESGTERRDPPGRAAAVGPAEATAPAQPRGVARRRLLAGALAGGAMAAAGAGTAGWLLLRSRHDDGRRDDADVRWKVSFDPEAYGLYDASARRFGLIAGDLLYLKAFGGLLAFDLATGRQRWGPVKTPFDPGETSVASVPVLGDGLVFVVYHDGDPVTRRPDMVQALDAGTGAVRWSYTGGHTDFGDPPELCVAGDAVVANTGGRLVALDGTTGAERWSYKDAAFYTSPAFGAGLVCTGSNQLVAGNTTVLAVDAATGKARWRTASDSPSNVTRTRMTVARGVVYRYGWDGHGVVALELATGRQLWSASGGVTDHGLPLMVSGDTVYSTTTDVVSRTMIALDAATGANRWTFTAAGNTGGQAAEGDAVHLATDVGLYTLDAVSGGQRRLYKTDVPVYAPLVVGDTVYTVASGKQAGAPVDLYALRAQASPTGSHS